MPKPSDWQHHHVDPPTSDNDYFERMSRIIFMSGLNWATLEKKWPGIKQAFRGFDIQAVAALGERDIAELMQNSAVIRNEAKIKAIIANAREFQSVIDEHSSFAAYLNSLKQQGTEVLVKQLIKRFAFMGKGTARIFLFSVGEDDIAHSLT
jgi:DNA-3-methyladenine glycosylase I